jgi:chorismate synthase
MKRFLLIAVAALTIPAGFASASSSVSTETIASRVASGKMSVSAVNNFVAGSGLDYADVQGMSLTEAAVLVNRLIDEKRTND